MKKIQVGGPLLVNFSILDGLYLHVIVISQAVNKLAEIMNRKDFNATKQGKKVNASELRKKEKELRKMQQEFGQVCFVIKFWINSWAFAVIRR